LSELQAAGYKADDDIANVLTMDEARRVASNIAQAAEITC
jgi:hypothetical protein